MKLEPENSMANSRQDRTKRLDAAQLLHGPAHRALSYTYSYACSRSGDVLGYIKREELRLYFTEEELQLLRSARTPQLFTIPLLFKIFRYCCDDKLQDCYSSDWDHSRLVGRPTSLEAHLAALHYQYTAFVAGTAGDVEGLVYSILGVAKGVGEKLGVNKWKIQHDALKQSIEEILEDVQPGLDFKERIANAAKLESDLRNQALTAAVHRHQEQTRRTCSMEEEDALVLQNMEFMITLVQDRTVEKHGKIQQEDDEIIVLQEEILDDLTKRCSEKIDGKKICCVSGEHGTGKSTLAAMFPVSWCKQDGRVNNLAQYDHIILVSGKDIEQTSIKKWVSDTKSQRNDINAFVDDHWSVAEAFLPGCCAKYGVKNVGQYLMTKTILFIVDDAEEISEGKVKELVLFLGQIVFESSVLIFGNLESITKIKFSFISFSSVQHLHLHGISKEYVLNIATKFRETVKSGKKKVQKTFKDSIKPNMSRIGHLLQYPEIFKESLSMWKTRVMLVKEVFTASELLWNLFSYKTSGAFEVNLDKDIRKKRKWLKWLMVAGNMALYCVKANLKLNEASLAQIKESADQLFSTEYSNKLMETFFKKRLVFHEDSFTSTPCSTCQPQLEYLSSYYVANKLKTDEALKNYLPNNDPEEFIALIAGHLKRWYSDGHSDEEIAEEDTLEMISGVIKTLVHYDTGKQEDIQFLLKLATEFRCSHKLVQRMVKVTEYPEEWDLQLCSVQQRSLEVMLQHVAAVRIILRTDNAMQNCELVSVLKFLGKVPISIWFDSRQQFEYDSNKNMDKILRPFLNDKIMSRIDLFAGSLSRGALLDFPDFKSTSYIVMLALKVTDEESLSDALRLPSHLPHILWFELKMEMSIENVNLTALPKMEVEMFDVYLSNLDDACVPQITGLLTKLHKRYSGIHLDNTTLAPESIYTILKTLKQRKIKLFAAATSIDKYRRWYYPLLANMPTDRLLTDKEVHSVLGFDDRQFYSDHKIQSSRFVRSIEAWNLTSYLEDLKEIKYFMYKADNMSFVKTLEGEVETEHHSSIQVDTSGAIL